MQRFPSDSRRLADSNRWNDLADRVHVRRLLVRVRRHGFAIGFAVLFLLAGSIEHASAMCGV